MPTACRHWKTVPGHTAFGLSICEWVHECMSLFVPKTLWTPYLKNQWREFRPILIKDVFGFVDVLIRSWGQKVRGQGHSRQWPKDLVNTISQKSMKRISPNFDHRCIWVLRCASYILGSVVYRSRWQQAMIRKTGWLQYLCNYLSYFHQN